MYTRPEKHIASEMFRDAIYDKAGTTSMHCDCGILHYTLDEDQEGYVEGKNEKFHAGDDFVLSYEIDGRYFVDGCEECMKKMSRYEQWIWNNRNTIRNYLKSRVDSEKRWADEEALLNTLANI